MHFLRYLQAVQYFLMDGMVLFIGTAYLVAGWRVIASAARNIIRGRVFNKQFLMPIATVGAIAIGELHEAIAVMLFYVVGELFQDIAVGRSRRSIKSLLEVKPEMPA